MSCHVVYDIGKCTVVEGRVVVDYDFEDDTSDY